MIKKELQTRNGCRIVLERYGNGIGITVTQKDAVREDVVAQLMKLAPDAEHFGFIDGTEEDPRYTGGQASICRRVHTMLEGKVLTSAGKSETYVLGHDEAGTIAIELGAIAGLPEVKGLIESVREHLYHEANAKGPVSTANLQHAMRRLGFTGPVETWKAQP